MCRKNQDSDLQSIRLQEMVNFHIVFSSIRTLEVVEQRCLQIMTRFLRTANLNIKISKFHSSQEHFVGFSQVTTENTV